MLKLPKGELRVGIPQNLIFITLILLINSSIAVFLLIQIQKTDIKLEFHPRSSSISQLKTKQILDWCYKRSNYAELFQGNQPKKYDIKNLSRCE